MYAEDQLLPLAGLQHLVFCERQFALMTIEGIWADNLFTVEGTHLHEASHDDDTEQRDGVRIARGLRLRSPRLGLTGVADVVEFHPEPSHGGEGVRLPGHRGLWRPYPVEYKHGKPKTDHSDEVQLCAQAICLEEMFAEKGAPVLIAEGAFFYGRPRRRTAVELTTALRQETETLAVRLHELFDSRTTPPAVYKPECRSCSLFDECRPKTTSRKKSAASYIVASFSASIELTPVSLPEDDG